MKERGVVFGDGRLLGVLTTPPDEDRDRPCVVILNAGVIHRVGPGRLSVDMARRAAAAGFLAFRFDLSGLGDSAPRVPPLGVVESANADVSDALDCLRAIHGTRAFVLVGLCSGAIHAHHAAAADHRVVGAALLDGYSYPTPRSRALAAVARLRSPLRLARAALRRATRLAGSAAPAPSLNDEDAFLPRWPSRARVEADLLGMMARGVELLYAFTGEWVSAYRYPGQMRDAFPRVPFGERLSERLIPEAEHLLFTRGERLLLLDVLAKWLKERFPATGRPHPEVPVNSASN